MKIPFPSFGKSDKDKVEKKSTQEVKNAAGSEPNPFNNPFNQTSEVQQSQTESNINPNPFEQSQETQPQVQEQTIQENSNPFEQSSSTTVPQTSQENQNPELSNPFSPQTTENAIPHNEPQSDLNHLNPLSNDKENSIQENPFQSSNSANSETSTDINHIQEMIDETVEKIMDEKFQAMVNNVEKVVSWKDSLEKQIDLIKQDLVNMQENFEKLDKRLTNKLSNYDKDILDVGSEIKALEKVFQKITPTLVNNVNELSKIAGDLKSMKPNNEDLSSKSE